MLSTAAASSAGSGPSAEASSSDPTRARFSLLGMRSGSARWPFSTSQASSSRSLSEMDVLEVAIRRATSARSAPVPSRRTLRATRSSSGPRRCFRYWGSHITSSSPVTSAGRWQVGQVAIARRYREHPTTSQTSYMEWSASGAHFLTEPKDHGFEIRAYIRDPDGHLIEVGQARM